MHRLSIIVVLLLAVTAFAQPRKGERPNIIFILTDDQAAWTTGFSGNREAFTPNMDRIAREGAYLPNAFAATPVCSPSRATIMTGRYASELGIDDWINPRSEPNTGLDPKTPVWPRFLRDVGYKTGLVGKWHLGTQPRFHPTKFGYDYFMGFVEGGCATKNPKLEEDGREQPFEGLTVDILTDRALRFIEQNKAGPFLLSLHYRAPHEAFLPVADEDMAHHKSLDPTVPAYPDLNTKLAKSKTRDYYASISGIDRNVGRLLAKLDELKLADNTVVIFTADHGYNIGQHGLRFKGNAQWILNRTPPQEWKNIPAIQRPNMFDTSLRVPLAIRWPRAIKPGTVVTQSVVNTDWFPTLLAMAGVEQPQDVTLRGHNFLPLLLGEQTRWNDTFYAEYNMRHGATTAMRVIRTPQWKLMIDFANDGRSELYDLTRDADEQTNRVLETDAATVEAREKLREQLMQTLRLIGDRNAP